MLILTVLNDMLGTMGEAPLNSIDDPHPYRAAGVSILNRVNREFQARGWWFNREALTLEPSGLDSSIYLPGDTINVRTENANFDTEQDVTLIRLVPFEECPELYAAYAAAEAVLRFQKRYDGDVHKTADLRKELGAAQVACVAEETRQSRVNLIEANPRLTYIKSLVRQVRGRKF